SLHAHRLLAMSYISAHTATTHAHPLPLHDALPISSSTPTPARRSCATATRRWPAGSPPPTTLRPPPARCPPRSRHRPPPPPRPRSEEHTSELQSREKIVCRLLLEKKNTSISWLIPQ